MFETVNDAANELFTELTPSELVARLDEYIIGQNEAKRAIAVAFRNRWRRRQVSAQLQSEITPKNILMIGPTGVGKTEIARRIAKLAGVPFVKVEATKYTEVGYVGKDVESIIRDLVERAIKDERSRIITEHKEEVERRAIDRVLDALLPGSRPGMNADGTREEESQARASFRRRLLEGELGDREVEIALSPVSASAFEIMTPPGMEELTGQLQGLFQSLGGDRKRNKRMKVSEALQRAREDEAQGLLDEDAIRARGLRNAEQGIVFIDEFDKIVSRSSSEQHGVDASRMGVQRDLLPIVEGSSVSTKYGMVNTDHILFIASGAFHLAKPSDIIPELQGRFPIRVELSSLSVEEFERVLTEPFASLTEQYEALLACEGITLSFSKEGVRRIAEVAFKLNETTENIGARRLHTVLERLLQDLSFNAPTMKGESVLVDAAYVDSHLGSLVKNTDLSRYIL